MYRKCHVDLARVDHLNILSEINEKDRQNNDAVDQLGRENATDGNFQNRGSLVEDLEEIPAPEIQTPTAVRDDVADTPLGQTTDIANLCLTDLSACEYAFSAIVGDNADYIEPTSFEEAWNHPDPTQQARWRESIKKEFGDMQK